MENSKQTGKWGEVEAVRLMKARGMEVLDVNWTFLHLEIDIVAFHNNQLVIGEVKTRSSNAYGEPEMFVTRQKQKKLIRAANMYMQHKNLTNEVRFDVIGIVRGPFGVTKNYIEGAFNAWE